MVQKITIKGNKTESINMRIEPRQKRRIEQNAKALGASVTKYLSQLIENDQLENAATIVLPLDTYVKVCNLKAADETLDDYILRLIKREVGDEPQN